MSDKSAAFIGLFFSVGAPNLVAAAALIASRDGATAIDIFPVHFCPAAHSVPTI
jgi:hypothetical protein